MKRLFGLFRFIMVHWFSFFMGFVGTVVLIVYIVARVKYSDMMIRVGTTYMADLIALVLFLLLIFLAIIYVERQHMIRAQLSRTKDALSRSEQRLRNILEQANDIIFAINEKGSMTFVSPNVEKIIGFEPGEIIGRHFSEFLGEDSKPIASYHFKMGMNGEIDSVDTEINLITEDGRLLPMNLRASATRYGELFTGVMGMLADISESQRMKADLLKYNRALSVLFEISDTISDSFNVEKALDESLSSVVEMTGLDSGCIYVLAEREYGLDLVVSHGLSVEFVDDVSTLALGDIKPEAISLPAEDGIYKDDGFLPEHARDSARKEGLQFVCAVPLLAGGRLVGIMNLSSHLPARLDDRDTELLQSVAQKLAVALENSRLLDELVKSHTQLEATLESIDDPVAVLDVSGEIAYINSRLEKYLGHPRRDIIGSSVTEILLEERERLPDLTGTPEQVAEAVSVLLTKGSVPFEINVAAGKDRHTFQVVITKIDVSCETVGYVCVMHDITGYKRLDQMRSDFVAAASHQLRTPLASVVGFSETILNHFGDLTSSDIREYTEIVARQGRKLAAIVNDLLDFSRLEEGAITVERESVFVPELAEKVLLDFKMGSTDHRFILDFEPGFPSINADGFKVEHILNNLVANSVKYSQGGGSITIGGRIVEKGIEVWVSDEGIGMTPDELSKLFDRFYRLPHQKSVTGPGTGLGLYIVKMLVDAHGGDIRVESEPGIGSTFTFFIPDN